MNSDQQTLNLIRYACVSKETIVLAEISFGEEDLSKLALQCLENIPQFHRSFSHTIGSKIYVFLIEDPFVYFGVFDEQVGKLQAFQFLERVKDSFIKISKKSLAKGLLNNVKLHYFQQEFSPVFRRLVASKDLRLLKSPDTSITMVGVNQNGVIDPRMSGKKAVSVPLLGKVSNKSSKKKKKNPLGDEETRGITIENKVDVSDDIVLTRDFSASLQKNGSYIGHTGRVHAKNMWRRHVRIVLLADLVICSVLFGVWLYICKGFKCIG
ncbi:hypothetical protein AQUCO_03700202v1 [Aquilegia coerulea]|uniref:Longin domain-containing protein n=1 Tax=Aquilegia coerulea TaxID=218851 RepID=A0A2G5CU12_AQUCA|nr:hypothetical protein AQUCO_03700202v1 [Aquilegia coerulea]